VRGSVNLGRLLAVVVGALMVPTGLAAVGQGGTAALAGAGLIVIGLGLIFAGERRRYRSESSERFVLPIGPGGGEPPRDRLENRFQRTDERFVDPTSGHTMRVWLDRTSGERRYLAED
jgi:hypothetical protein